MGKYRVNVTFSLVSSVEPDGYVSGLDGDADVVEVEESSTFYAETVSVTGGDVWLTVEAEDEAAASEKAVEVFERAAEWNGYGSEPEWEFESVEAYDVEPVEEPMTADRALETLETYLRGLGPNEVPAEVVAAILFLLQMVRDMQARQSEVTV